MAAELAASAVANAVGNWTTEYALPYVSYFFHFGKTFQEFKNQRKELELKKDRVKNDVNAAIRQTEVIEKDVQDWLKEAETELEDAHRLEVEIELKKCFNWCPNWAWRYCLSKKVAKKTSYINKLLQKCDFQRVGIRPPLQGIEFFPSKDFKSSKSSNSAFDGIMRALITNGVNMIGLHGMAGVGKTTLAKEVGKHAKEQKLFDNVVMVTMSQTPNISNIQGRIAELLGLEFKAITEEGKAEELWRRLKGEKKILIIIDDVWNEFRLQNIGIPSGVEHDGCKILLTMRLQQVCVQMNCQEKFQLDILSGDEAWALFKDNAGLNDVSSTLNDVAKELACECNGLPLAIVTIAKALKGASLNEWTAANQRLKDSRHLDNEDVCESVYNCLKLSYDYLRGDNIRSCFLLCSIFPEDFPIDIELLIMFGIGYGLFSHIYSVEDLRREICGALKKLQEFGLLLKIGDDEFDHDDDEIYLSMHDVVRDFAHWMTLKEENIFMVKEGLTKWPMSENFECHTSISFWNCKINNFPSKLEFPKLKIFVFSGKNVVRVPTAFVEGMKALRVLHFINVGFSLEIFKFIINLRTLCIKNCLLKDISSLKYLKDLEILVLLDTNVHKLPEELVALSRLKSLHFSYSGKQHCNFPLNLLSRLTSLQELHVTCLNNIDLSELNSLSDLTALSLTISTDQCFPETFMFPKLQRYMISVNEDNLRFMQGLNFRALEIKDFSSSLSAFKELFCNVENLALDCCNDMECLMDTTRDKEPTTAFSNLVKLYMEDMPCLKELSYGQPPIRFLQKLKDVNIQFCEQLKVIFQMEGIFANGEISQTPLLSNLTSLDLIFLPNLESIWKLQSTHQYHASLRSLRGVKIHLCNELKSIFSTCVAQNLLHLQQLDVSNCQELEDVFDFPQGMAQLEIPLLLPFLYENQVPSLSNLTDLDLEILPKLKWIWKGPTHLVTLKSLKTMRISFCMKLAYLFPAPLAQSLVHLEQLQILSCDSLEHIIMEEEENDNEIVSDILQHHHPLCFPKLRTLDIIYCGSLKYVFPSTLAQGLPHLESVVITNCSQLKQVFKMMKATGGPSRGDIALQRLQFLKLENLDNFSSFCPENFVISLSLKEFKVRNCPRLAHFGNQQGVPLNIELEDVPSYGFKELLCNAKNVTMDSIMYHKNLVPIVDPKGVNEVTFLTLKDGRELECLIDTTDQGHVSTVAFLNLVDLVIEKMNGFKMLCNGPFPKGFLKKLEKLETSNCMELVSLSPALQNVKEVRVINCGQLREVFQTEELLHDMEENQAPLLSNLTRLELKSLPELNCVWKVPNRYISLRSLKIAEISQCNRLKYLFSPSLAQSLVLLEQLKIKHCCGLKHIITELEVDDNIESNDGHLHPPLLPKLTTLEIHYCTRLEYVFQIPFAQGLPHLKSLLITNAPQLKHIFNVAKEKNAVHHAIALPRLQHLRLENLINLSCFCSENYPIVSSSLEKLIVMVCPRFEIFTIQQGVNEQLQLKELQLSELGHDNVRDTISRKNTVQIQAGRFLSRIAIIYQLQGPIEVASLQYLRELRVSECKRLKSLFSYMLAQNLPQLNFLHIECCEQLEEIIEMDQTSVASSSQGRLQPIFFPNLELIWIDRCSNLKSLFPISVIHSLSKLKDIEIHAASKLEQIFGYQGEPNVKDDHKEIVFPELEDLVISKLPSLKSFATMGYHCEFPSLDYIKITECPNLTTSFIKTSRA